MTITTDVKVNTTLSIPFLHQTLSEGETVFPTTILKDGVLYTGLSQAPVYVEHGNGLYSAQINFNSTGYFTVFVAQSIAAYVHVVSKDTYSILTDLDDVAQGSWKLDKKTMVLTLYRQGGTTVLRTYDFKENNDQTSRELAS